MQMVPIPKYLMIRSILESRLERHYAAGDRIPTEATRRGIRGQPHHHPAGAALMSDGLVSRERGRGTFYRGPSARLHEAKPSQSTTHPSEAPTASQR